MATSAIVTRGYLVDIADVVTAGYLAGAAVVTSDRASGRNQRRVKRADPWFPGNQDDWTPKTTAEVMHVNVKELPIAEPDVLTVADEQEIERLIQSAETLSGETSARLAAIQQKADQLRRKRRREEEFVILAAIMRRN